MSEPVTNVEYLYNASEDPDVLGRLPRAAHCMRRVIEAMAEMVDPFDAAISQDEPDPDTDEALCLDIQETVTDAFGDGPEVEV